MQNKWWQVAKNTPVYEELLECTRQRKSDFYKVMTEALADSKEYSLGYKVLKPVRAIFNRIHVGG